MAPIVKSLRINRQGQGALETKKHHFHYYIQISRMILSNYIIRKDECGKNIELALLGLLYIACIVYMLYIYTMHVWFWFELEYSQPIVCCRPLSMLAN